MADIFVSYTRSDLEWATWTAETAEAAGRTCVLQEWDSLPGTNFVSWIDTQIGRAKWVMPIYSRAYFDSKWCTSEWTSALARSSILPVKVDACVIPAILATITYVDISEVDEITARENILFALRIDKRPRASRFGFPGVKAPPGTDRASKDTDLQSRWARIAFALAADEALLGDHTARDAIDDDDDDV